MNFILHQMMILIIVYAALLVEASGIIADFGWSARPDMLLTALGLILLTARGPALLAWCAIAGLLHDALANAPMGIAVIGFALPAALVSTTFPGLFMRLDNRSELHRRRIIPLIVLGSMIPFSALLTELARSLTLSPNAAGVSDFPAVAQNATVSALLAILICFVMRLLMRFRPFKRKPNTYSQHSWMGAMR